MELTKPAVFRLGMILFLSLTTECFARSATKRDLADVLPAASLFARKTDPFGHYLGYTTGGVDLVGIAFVTAEVVPEESWGYGGQIATLVGVDAEGKITGVKVLSESESPRYARGLLRDGSWFLKQFQDKDAGDNFILESDVDAITGATMTSSAVTRSIKVGLELITEEILHQQVDKRNPVENLFLKHLLWQSEFIFLWITVGLAFLSFFSRSDFLRYFTLGLSFGYLGILKGGGFSVNDVLRLCALQCPVFPNNLYWYSLVFIAIGLALIAGRFYCGWLCPFGAILEVLYRVVPIEWTVGKSTDKHLKVAKYVILAILLLIAFPFANRILAGYLAGIVEPFAAFFNLHGSIAWMWLVPMLFLSSAIPRFYCRYFCPLGAFFALLCEVSSFLRLRQLRVDLPEDNCRGCRLAQKCCQMDAITYDEQLRKPSIDRNECLMCHTCTAQCPIVSGKGTLEKVSL